jgi:hypothetical protein
MSDLVVGEDRLEELWSELKESQEECPFLIESAEEPDIRLRHYHGGRDATYVVVWRTGIFASQPPTLVAPRPGATAKVRYPSFVAGTTIIYDATAETMQGKARPFVCDLTKRARRVYALLPYQIESVRAQATVEEGNVNLKVSFLDAREEVIQAAMPFEQRFIPPNGKELRREFRSTARDGVYDRTPKYNWRIAPGKWQMVVRSLLANSKSTVTFVPPT